MPEANFETSQNLPAVSGKDSENPNSGTIENKEPKADEHGTKKSAETGSTLTADATETSRNPETISPPANEPAWKKAQRELLEGKKEGEEGEKSMAPALQSNSAKLAEAAKLSATNPATAPGANHVTDVSTEAEDANSVTILVKRVDGTTLQFPMTFIGEKQDVYNTKNMLDLVGKLIKKSAKELEEEFPAFIRK